MPTKITSVSNPKIKQIFHLRKPADRQAHGLTVIEGHREIMMAFDAKVRIKELYIFENKPHAQTKKIIDQCSQLKIPVYETSSAVFAKMAYGDHRQGILAVCERPVTSLKAFKISSHSLIVIVEGVEKPGNLGAILRTCDAVGVDGVIFCDPKTDVYNPNVIRASLGAIFTVNVAVASLKDVFDFLKSHKIKVYAASPKGRHLYSRLTWDRPLAIVVGSEDAGLSDAWFKDAHTLLHIPMRGKVDSLNVSTTVGILVYEAMRQRS